MSGLKSPAVVKLLAFLLLATSLVAVPPGPAGAQETADSVRFATFNASLNRREEGALLADLQAGDEQAAQVAAIVAEVDPDVLLINEFDYDVDAAALYAEQLGYEYHYVAPSNTGVPSGLDLDNDGATDGPGDSFGFGFFEGQFGMLLVSKYPIDTEGVRTFQNFLWADMPDNLMPTDFYSDDAQALLRLSSKSHWDVPIQVGDETIHALVSHPTPPVFDGEEDRNGTRNHDEIRFWADYIAGANYMTDDAGTTGGLAADTSFVIMGDLNADPNDGDSTDNPAALLLDNALVNTTVTPTSDGGPAAAAEQAGANVDHTGDPAFDTADFGDETPGNLRVDYVLPDAAAQIVDAGVYWPVDDPIVEASDHRLVWVDLATASGDDDTTGTPGTQFALIADLPYGEADTANAGVLVDAINADPDVEFIVHLGDIKSGGTMCTDEAFAELFDIFATFDDPMVYTPGDNEWTDCHRESNGQFVPTERLDKIREVFFPDPYGTLGGSGLDLQSQADDPNHPLYRENRLWDVDGVVMSTIHVVGSNNNLREWNQLPDGDQPDVRLAEYEARNAASLAWLDATFGRAAELDSPAVIVNIHANMFEADPADGFADFLASFEAHAISYGKPVILTHGDFHYYREDQPFENAPNVTRIQAFGAEIDHWIEFTIDPAADEVVTWESHLIAPEVTLAGHAVLPAVTFAEGPPAGRALGIDPINGAALPFDDQPVQGFSAIADLGDGTFAVMSDNGFGSIENSADYNLRVYTIQPSFTGASGGDGTIEVLDWIELSDPNGHISFPIVNEFSDHRTLTGADFDLEGMQIAPDGTLWFGDEFGPFLIHTDADGVVLSEPIPLPGLRSPQSPDNEDGTAALRLMNAIRADALANGNTNVPVMSPWHVMLADDIETSSVGSRDEAPEGLDPASSEVYDVASLQRAGYPVVVWTVNDKERMTELLELGVDGIISDRPDLLYEAIAEYDADGDGTPGDYLLPDGRIDITKIDAQGHRGARNLRPENTVPSMEAALDHLMTTLELDTGLTNTDELVLGHDPLISAQKCRHIDGTPYTDEIQIRDISWGTMQREFVCDGVFRGDAQSADLSLSPVSVIWADLNRKADPYVPPTLEDVFRFVRLYEWYYTYGEGMTHPAAEARAANAADVRFNIEAKTNPRPEFIDRTLPAEDFAASMEGDIRRHGLIGRADIQSFDWSSLLAMHELNPEIRTIPLFGDFPKTDAGGDGTNLQPLEDGTVTPWLAGMTYPYRVTTDTEPFLVRQSGGFEGLALSADGTTLLTMLEKPIVGGEPLTLLISEFDLETESYTGVQWNYRMNPDATAIGDFVMIDETRGLVIERDGSQGDLGGFKAIYEVTLFGGGYTEKRAVVDLLDIDDPDGVALPGIDGDVGTGDGSFAFPFVTIEDVVIIDEDTIGVLNDNNYPFSIGRHVGAEIPDDNEFILLDLPTPLLGG